MALVGALGVEGAVGFGFGRLAFESGFCHLEVGDLGKSCDLSLIFYEVGVIIPYLTDKQIIRIL